MCRWAAWIGQSIFLEDVVSRPGHSLIVQAREATKCKTAINADGFGLAWYDGREEPGLYRDVHPAWSDPNLKSLCAQVRSRLFMAHVRASTGTATSRNNCHPFVVGKWSFMHNGQVGGFEHFRKQADMAISDTLYSYRKGATDSEALFLLTLGEDIESDPVMAMERAVGLMQDMSQRRGQGPNMRLSAALSDGTNLWAFRYSSDNTVPSMFYRRDEKNGGWAVVSEPLEEAPGWTAIEPGMVARFSDERMDLIPFRPETSREIAA